MRMSMPHAPALHIGKLSTRFVSDGALDDTQVRQWHEAFAEQDADALVGRLVSDEEWLLIRHLPLHLRWRPDGAAADVGRAWLQALQVAVEDAASGNDAGNVLRYRVWRHGLADLLYRSALGETDRQWAWQRMGLLRGEGVAPIDALLQGAQALLDQPDLIWPVLHHCLLGEPDTGAFTALARRVPAPMWARWMQAAPQTRAWMQACVDMARGTGAAQAPARDAPAHEPDAASTHEAAVPAWARQLDTAGTPAQALLRWAERHPSLATPLGDVFAVWLLAMTGTRPGTGHAAGRRMQAVRQRWQAATQARAAAPLLRQSSRLAPRPGLPTPPAEASQTGQQAPLVEAARHGPMQASSGAPIHADLPEAPTLPEPGHTLHTAWAGALFFLRLLCQPDVMATLRAQAGSGVDEDADDAVFMQAVAMALRVPADDPVMHVMTAGRATPETASATLPRIQTAANRLVAQWARWLDEAMPDAPEPRLTWVCQRPGRLRIEPGWIELHLDMDQIDTRLRRLGLDLDPGWVPLIGAVVRIRYD
jgi:hypothetical protein